MQEFNHYHSFDKHPEGYVEVAVKSLDVCLESEHFYLHRRARKGRGEPCIMVFAMAS